MMLLISLALTTVQIQKEGSARALTPSEIRADRYHYHNKRVTICGDAIGQAGPYSLLVSQTEYDTAAISIDPKIKVGRVADKLCATGVIKRFDGLTLKEAQKQGKSYVSVDTSFDAQYILRP
ncbi:hypothetical protein [Sphingomonas sp. Leaf22]|uniref:hypothetical protein n=1 Tax=Sphingomonas sp. Leaf22 TaxID=1735687 RepID=UPI0012E269EC|nr:hypothetical protein [Sphingomonas sp. Leaf22]